MFGVLKADAYGHGAPAVARTLERAGIDGFCVALLEEAVELREAGIRVPILVMGGYYGQAWGEVLARELTPVIYDVAQAEGIAREVRLATDARARRWACTSRSTPAWGDSVRRSPRCHAVLDAHRAHARSAHRRADDPLRVRRRREPRRGRRCSSRASKKRTEPHAASGVLVQSAARGQQRGAVPCARRQATIRSAPASRSSASRRAFGDAVDLRPVMTIRSEIVAVRELAKGERHRLRLDLARQRTSRIATIPMGYADGLSRQSLEPRPRARAGQARAHRRHGVDGLTMIDVTDHRPGARSATRWSCSARSEGPLGQDVDRAAEIARTPGPSRGRCSPASRAACRGSIASLESVARAAGALFRVARAAAPRPG